MKTLKVLLQEVVSGIKAWVNSNFAQESNTVHKTGNETVNGVKTFSSANILSEVNRVDKGLWFNGQREAYIFPENSASYSGLLFTTETYGQSFKFGDSTTSNDEVSFNYNNAYLSIYAGYNSNDNKNKVEISPRNADESSLGDSSYQWNNVYAKNYYYNGVAWGLDKYNWWSLVQFYAQNSIHVRNVNPGVAPSSEVTAGFRMENANASYAFGDVLCRVNTSGVTFVNLIASNKFTNGALDPNGTTASRNLQVGVRPDGSGFIYTDCGWRNNLVPHSMEQNLSLGISTNKWRYINGVNPGELSLPNMGTTVSQTIDITDWYIPDPDDPTYPDENAKKIDDSVEHTIEGSSHVGAGYIHIVIPNVSGNYAYARQYAMGTNMSNGIIANGLAFDAFPNISFIFPIVNALKVRIKAKTATVRFFPCLGNV